MERILPPGPSSKIRLRAIPKETDGEEGGREGITITSVPLSAGGTTTTGVVPINNS